MRHSTASVVLDGTPVGDAHPAYVIAECGHNHQGDIEEARRLIHMAKDAGCNACKLQKRDNRTLYTKPFYESAYNSENAYANTYGAHREYLEFSMSQYLELKDYAGELGITFFATPFDLPSVDFLENVGVPFYKVASGSIQNPLLLRRLSETGKPVIVSLGGATEELIAKVVDTLSAVPLVIMHCTAAYPAKAVDLGLGRITWLAQKYPQHVIGFSDHEDGVAMGGPAYILGARVFEKHITMSHTNKGTDHAFSLEYGGLRSYINTIRKTEAASVFPSYPLPSEKGPLTKMGYSCYTTRYLPGGHVITADDLAVKSPAEGLPGWAYDELIGKRLLVAVMADTPLDWSMFGGEF